MEHKKTFIIIYTDGIINTKPEHDIMQYTKVVYAKNKYQAIINFDKFMGESPYYLLDIGEFDDFELSANKGDNK